MVEQNSNKQLLFFDESRFGTHSKLGHGWFKKGTRTPVKVKQGFKNFYLYSAVTPLSGSNFTLLLPHVYIVYLTPYSPELNPVERLWQHIKRYTIRNKVYETINDLEKAVCCFLRKITTNDIKNICSASYVYNLI